MRFIVGVECADEITRERASASRVASHLFENGIFERCAIGEPRTRRLQHRVRRIELLLLFACEVGVSLNLLAKLAARLVRG